MENQEESERPLLPVSKKGKRQPRGSVSPLFKLASRRNRVKFITSGCIQNLNISLGQNSDVISDIEKGQILQAIRLLTIVNNNFRDNWEQIKSTLQAKLARNESQSQTTQSISGPSTENSESSLAQHENNPGEAVDRGTSGIGNLPGGSGI